MKSKFYFKRGKSEAWKTQNPVLGPGEPGFEIDTGRLKVGNGTIAWNDLEYVTDSSNLMDDVVKYLGSASTVPDVANDGEICEVNDAFYIRSNGQWKPLGKGETVSSVEVIKLRGNTMTIETVEINGAKYDNLIEAINAASEGDLISIPAAYNQPITIPDGKSVGIELNNVSIISEKAPISIGYGSTVTIDGAGRLESRGHGVASLENNGELYLAGGTFERLLDSEVNGFYTILNHGNMTIQNAIVACEKDYSSLVENGYYNYSSNDARTGYVEDSNLASPQLTINGGTFMGGKFVLKNDDNGEITINDGYFYGMILHCGVLLTINGGSFFSDTSENICAKNLNNSMNLGKIVINGGIFHSPLAFDNLLIRNNAEVIIKGGQFNHEVPQELIADGYQQSYSDGYYVISEK